MCAVLVLVHSLVLVQVLLVRAVCLYVFDTLGQFPPMAVFKIHDILAVGRLKFLSPALKVCSSCPSRYQRMPALSHSAPYT